MAKSFSELRNSRKQEFDRLNDELDKLQGGTRFVADDRFWQPTVDKAGNGFAVIRFMPAPPDEDSPFIRYWDHGFKGPGGQWYIENSRTTLDPNEPDPVAEMNRELWAQGENSRGRKIVSGSGKEQPGTKRRLHFVANVYVVNDPGKRENEGTIRLYKFGKKIFDKLNDAMHPPEIEGKDPVNPFDLWEGANFELRIRREDGYRNYSSSSFAAPSKLLDDDDAMEALWKQCFPLQPFIDPKSFKSYEELKAKLARVMGQSTPSVTAEEVAQEEPPARPRGTAAPKKQEAREPEGPPAQSEEELLSYFEGLGDE